jgi:two-component system cell cycle sensor histidine kinase/response regulator CckA
MCGERCVLVVDDDSQVRALAERALKEAGCSVMDASDGAHALEILEGREITIDLVLTDIRMPRLDGLELGRRIAQMTAPMPVVYMSGELPDTLVHGSADLTLAPFLLKPFSIGALVAAVIGLLGAGTAELGAPEAPLETTTSDQGEPLT